MERRHVYVYSSSIPLPFFTLFLLGLICISPVLSLIQKCYHCTDYVNGKNGSISGQCTRNLPGDSQTCSDVDDDIYRGFLLQDIFPPLGCLTSFKVYHDKTLDVVASVQRSCEVRSRNSNDGCSPKTTDSDASGEYAEVICRCSNEDNCNNIPWPTKDIGELPFTEPVSNKEVMDTYLAGKGRYCLIGSGTVDVRTGEQRGEGFFPDIKKQKRLCEHVPVIKNTIANYPAKSRFVYCKTVYEMHGSELTITRLCETQMVPVKDHCVKRGNVKKCYCNSDVCNNKVWDEESGMTNVPVVPVDMVELDVPESGSEVGFVVPKKNVEKKKPRLGPIFAPKLNTGTSNTDRSGMLNACHRCDGNINRNTGAITGSCFLVDSILTNPFSTQTLENCTSIDTEIADAVSTYPTTPLECVTTFTHYSDPRKTIEAKVERRCALKSPFSKDGCTQPERRFVKTYEEVSITCRCFSYDGCNTDKWTSFNMANTNPFALTPGTWGASVRNGIDSRARVCHVCWASRSSTSTAPACFDAASLSSNTKKACFDYAHITGIIINLPAETHFVHCFTKFTQTGSTQTMERGCEVRLAPVHDRCDSKGYCTCNSDGCNTEEWNDGGWQAAKGTETLIGEATSETSTVDIGTSESNTESTGSTESDNVTDAPPVTGLSAEPDINAGGSGFSGLVRSCYWCKGTVERTTGLLTGCFSQASAIKEDKIECGEKDLKIRTLIFGNKSTELECITVFRYNTDTYSTHEAILKRRCAVKPSPTPTDRCSKATTKSDTTGTHTEVVCRCANDDYCNDDAWPTTEMGRVPFTVPTAVLPPSTSDPNVTSVTFTSADPTPEPELTWPPSVLENTTHRRSSHHRSTTDQPVTFYPPSVEDATAYPSTENTKHRRSSHKPSTDSTADSLVWDNSTYEPVTDDTSVYPSTDTTKHRRSTHKTSTEATADPYVWDNSTYEPVTDDTSAYPSTDTTKHRRSTHKPSTDTTTDSTVWYNSAYGPVTDELSSSTKKRHRSTTGPWVPSTDQPYYESTTEPWVSSTDQPYVEPTTYPSVPSIGPVDSTVRHHRSRTTQPTSMAPPVIVTTRRVIIVNVVPPKPTEKPQQCACANPYCCPPPQSYPCGNPYGCQQWECTDPAYCPPPGPNPWSCTNIMNCRPPGPNPWNCSSPWDCDVPDKNVWNCSCPWNCGQYEPWNCKSPFDCKPPSDYQKCLNDRSKCRDVPQWLIRWWGTHQQQTFPNLPPVSISQTQTVVHKNSQSVVFNLSNQAAGPSQKPSQPESQLDVEGSGGNANGVSTKPGSSGVVIRHGEYMLLFAFLYVYLL